MDRAIFTGREFLLLSLAMNHAEATLFKNGFPGIPKEDITMLRKKVHALGTAARKGNKIEETFTLRDGEPEPEGWKIPAVEA